MKIDKKDKMILKELQDNCKKSSRQLSKKLGIPATTIHERIKKLEKNKVILGYHVDLDANKLGLPSAAIVLVRRMPKTAKTPKIVHKQIGEMAAKLPEVQDSFIVTGEYDMVLKVRAKNEKEIGSYIVNTIWNMPEVERTLTLMIFHTSKESCELNLD